MVGFFVVVERGGFKFIFVIVPRGDATLILSDGNLEKSFFNGLPFESQGISVLSYVDL